jgi:hypothetical protein
MKVRVMGGTRGLIDSRYYFYLFPEQSSADSTFSKKKRKAKAYKELGRFPPPKPLKEVVRCKCFSKPPPLSTLIINMETGLSGSVYFPKPNLVFVKLL